MERICMEELVLSDYLKYKELSAKAESEPDNLNLQKELKKLKTSIETICRINDLSNPLLNFNGKAPVQKISDILNKHNISSMEIQPAKSIEDEIADLLPGPVKEKVEPDIIKRFTSSYGNIEWNQTKKIITFDNGVVFTEDELLAYYESNPGKEISPEAWSLKCNFNGHFEHTKEVYAETA